jgi:hypothetical protein
MKSFDECYWSGLGCVLKDLCVGTVDLDDVDSRRVAEESVLVTEIHIAL